VRTAAVWSLGQFANFVLLVKVIGVRHAAPLSRVLSWTHIVRNALSFNIKPNRAIDWRRPS
jgi:hypothetical protein